jgi:hypothetical protein
MLAAGCSTTYLPVGAEYGVTSGGIGVAGDKGTLPPAVLEAVLRGPNCPYGDLVKDWPESMKVITEPANLAMKTEGSATVWLKQKFCAVFIKRDEKAIYAAYAGSRVAHPAAKLPPTVFDDPNLAIDLATAQAALGLPVTAPAGQPAKK